MNRAPTAEYLFAAGGHMGPPLRQAEDGIENQVDDAGAEAVEADLGEAGLLKGFELAERGLAANQKM